MALRNNRIVIKIGTSTLVNEAGATDLKNIEKLVRIISDIHNMGYEVVIVSSGAIAFGANKLRADSRPKNLRMKLATAAVGQCSLLHLYDKVFEEYDKTIAQVLLSAEDVKKDSSRENLISTFDTLLMMGVIPIVNENDSVSSLEIESDEQVFGDNDMLSALVTEVTKAGLLVILSDIDDISGKGSRRGDAGVKSKIAALDYVGKLGTNAYIIKGKNPELLYDIIDGKKTGIYKES